MTCRALAPATPACFYRESKQESTEEGEREGEGEKKLEFLASIFIDWVHIWQTRSVVTLVTKFTIRIKMSYA